MVSETPQKTTFVDSNDDNPTPIKFLPSFVTGVLGSGFCLIFLCILLILPILNLVFGLVFQNQCTIDHRIPIYLIVTGACGIATISIILIMVLCFLCLFKKNSLGTTFVVVCIIGLIVTFTIILSLFLSVWSILGSVWIFQVKSTVNLNDPTSAYYCHPTLYNFAFWILITGYIIAFLSAYVPCCIAVCCCGKFLKSET